MTRTKLPPTPSNGSLKGKALILIADDHELLRYGLKTLISSDPRLEVCGEAANRAAAMQLARRKTPDVVVVDISLGDDNGLDLIRWLRKNCPSARVIVSTMHEEKIYGERALRAGAQGYVCKQDPAETVLRAIHSVLENQMFFSEDLTKRVLQRAAEGNIAIEASPVDGLSDRELEVFRLIGRGLTAQQIAHQLHLSASTLDTYRSRLKIKLSLETGTQLTRRAVEWVLENG